MALVGIGAPASSSHVITQQQNFHQPCTHLGWFIFKDVLKYLSYGQLNCVGLVPN